MDISDELTVGVPSADLQGNAGLLFHTAVLTRLARSIGHEIEHKNNFSWTWPADHWSLWVQMHGDTKYKDSYFEAFRNLLKNRRANLPHTLISASPEIELWAPEGAAICHSSILTDHGDVSYYSIEHIPSSFSQSLIEEALDMLHSSWPVAWQAFQLLVRDIVVLRGGGLKSATTPLTFGAVYINLDLVSSAIELVSLLVHESAHHSLYIKQTVGRYISTEKHLLASPLRTESRPPLFVLHATYVSERIATAMLYLSEHLTGSERARAIRLGRMSMIDLIEGTTTLNSAKCMTELGERLLNWLMQRGHLLQREFQ